MNNENFVFDVKVGLNYDDVSIVPEVVTDIVSRKECDPFVDSYHLPIFAAPMGSVVNKENINWFNNNHIKVVVPRKLPIGDRLEQLKRHTSNFVSFSIDEAKKFFVEDEKEKLNLMLTKHMSTNDYEEYIDLYEGKYRICIDIANGHMKSLIDLCKEIKSIWGDSVVIMTGNIANPETYRVYEEAGVDFVRVGIAGGSACLTGTCTGVYYPYFSLLKETYEIKKAINGKCKIIADGNIKDYRDIQKALIYASYVMIGGLFNKAMESAGKTTYGKSYWNVFGYKIVNPFRTLFTYGNVIPRRKWEKCFRRMKEGKLDIYKEHYGESTKKAQVINGKGFDNLKTSEGKVFKQLVKYDLQGWVENEIDYLRSAMSYTNSRDLNEYKESLWVRNFDIKYNK